ncbi:MAG: LCP family protein [Coriobacteriales bacterium]|nr:LCP family protein [Coriobacteriales bacterium]
MGKHSKKRGIPLGGSSGGDREVPGKRTRPRPVRSPKASRSDLGSPAEAPNADARRAALDKQLSPQVKKARRRRVIMRSLIAATAFVLVLGAAAAAWGYYFLTSTDRQITKASGVPGLAKVLRKEEPQKPFTILLLGADYRPGETSFRSDSIILAKVDPEKKKVWMLSIPRDTKVDIPGYGTHKINAAHALGGKDHGPEMTVKAVERLTGIPINHYAEINFRGFQKAVDALGGVWVDVDVEIDDWKADKSPGHRAKHIDPGYQKLDGEHALTFCRSRNFPDADFTRMRHQQMFFKALADQMKNSPMRAPSAVNAVAKYLKTDLTVMQMLRVAMAMKDTGKSGIYTATIPGEWESPFIYLDEAKMAQLIDAFNDGRPFGKKEKKKEVASTIPPGDISVSVRNGCGVAGAAGEAADVLKAGGYELAEVGNAKKSDYDVTLVVYDGDDRAAAESVAAALPAAQIIDGQGQYGFSSRVLVVVGKDWKKSAAGATTTQVRQ